jgi:NAD(P)H-hydrate epimerase
MPASRRKTKVLRTRRVRGLAGIPERPHAAHKGDFGRVLIVAGSPGMTGAAALAGESALRAGAGMALVACPEGCNPILEVKLTSCMTRPLPQTKAGTISKRAIKEILALQETWPVLAIGCGISTHRECRDLVLGVLPKWKGPLVVDADGLTHVATRTEVLEECHEDIVLTPHPGEFARLSGKSIRSIQGRRSEAAAEFAAAHKVVTVLKGSGTVVTDGERVYVNGTGNPGMATAGSGDVLTGIIGGLLGQGVAPFEASALGVHLHGLAGDIAARDVGEVSLVAEDLVTYLPRAVQRHQRRKR